MSDTAKAALLAVPMTLGALVICIGACTSLGLYVAIVVTLLAAVMFMLALTIIQSRVGAPMTAESQTPAEPTLAQEWGEVIEVVRKALMADYSDKYDMDAIATAAHRAAAVLVEGDQS